MKLNKTNDKGQVLMIVMLVGMISLVITMGMVSRVSRLTKTVVETEEHEVAFSTSEKYSRRILDSFERGELLDQVGVDALITKDDEIETVSITVNDGVGTIAGVTVDASETYEMVISPIDAGKNVTITLEDGSVENALLTVVFFDGTVYSVQKRLFVNCASNNGDLTAGCNTSEGIDTISYIYTGSERAVRIKFLSGDARFTVMNNAGAIANQYTITTTQVVGDEAGVQSETILYIPKTKSMPSLFDYVLFNGTGQIDKSTN